MLKRLGVIQKELLYLDILLVLQLLRRLEFLLIQEVQLNLIFRYLLELKIVPYNERYLK